MSWYDQYEGQSVGRILHFLYEYCGLNIAEQAIVGNSKIHYPYEGHHIATFTFDEFDVPTFVFEANKFISEESVRTYTKNQADKKEKILAEERERLIDKTGSELKKLYDRYNNSSPFSDGWNFQRALEPIVKRLENITRIKYSV